MAKLKITIFKDGDSAPDVTITVPLGVFRVASKLVPRKIVSILEEHGIEINQIVELSRLDEPLGTLAEIEEHKRNKRIVISME